MIVKVDRPKPVIFLDFDDVICLNNPFGGYDVMLSFSKAERSESSVCEEDELWVKLFDADAKGNLELIHREFQHKVCAFDELEMAV